MGARFHGWQFIVGLLLLPNVSAYAPFEELRPAKPPSEQLVTSPFHRPPYVSDQNLVHKIVPKKVTEWERTVLPHLDIREHAHSAWAPNALWGTVWTRSENIPPWGTVWASAENAPSPSLVPTPDQPGTVTITFEVDSSYGFYDWTNPEHKKLWSEWEENHSSLPNTFPKAQMEQLQRAGWPYHSEFYKQNRILGIYDPVEEEGQDMSSRTIVDFAGVDAISIERPNNPKRRITWSGENLGQGSCDIELTKLIKRTP